MNCTHDYCCGKNVPIGNAKDPSNWVFFAILNTLKHGNGTGLRIGIHCAIFYRDIIWTMTMRYFTVQKSIYGRFFMERLGYRVIENNG